MALEVEISEELIVRVGDRHVEQRINSMVVVSNLDFSIVEGGDGAVDKRHAPPGEV